MSLQKLEMGVSAQINTDKINLAIDEINKIEAGEVSIPMAIDQTARDLANAAQLTANSGVTKADAAQLTANSGVEKADAAQATANNGLSIAQAAMPKEGGNFTNQVSGMTAPNNTVPQFHNMVIYPAGTDINAINVSAGTLICILK